MVSVSAIRRFSKFKLVFQTWMCQGVVPADADFHVTGTGTIVRTTDIYRLVTSLDRIKDRRKGRLYCTFLKCLESVTRGTALASSKNFVVLAWHWFP